MKIYRGLKRIPIWEKVVGHFKIETVMDLPDALYTELLAYFSKLKFTPKADQCTFYLTSAGNYSIEGLDQQELNSILTRAYCGYVNSFVYENRNESFNGLCYATRQEFIEECQDRAYAKCFMDKSEFKRFCELNKRISVVAA